MLLSAVACGGDDAHSDAVEVVTWWADGGEKAGDYPAYQQSAMADWKNATQVPSCAHGSACSQAMQNAVNSAMAQFSADVDEVALQRALAEAASRFAAR